ncbi:chorismate mutase [Roseivirga thermotolerans]|uniref:chorismate mutase n=2 Tax=Roseivirga TaxID=290180 RepID=A0ABQ3I970_9BACT|nr:chorismate mutase [Roseivirga thermotolerans]GHE66301.1 cytochrome c4 [Roseivirga thermotolerans]
MVVRELKDWYPQYNKPLLISGPCSVETEEQLRNSVLPIIDKVDFVRGGIWKPRTRPGNFEGHGERALQWVQALRKETPFKFAMEVATPEHVELAHQYEVDLVWIGARTTVNPFNVAELAESFKGSELPVFIKNPIHAELSLWKGALERFSKAGVSKLGAIHRGFHSYQKNKYRNVPMWQIPLDLKSEFPELPLLCDPSHIAGDRGLVAEIAQRALDLNYDGLMIESHCKPDAAWSDAAQQIATANLPDLINGLLLRDDVFTKENIINQLELIREQIDQADRELLEALNLRMNLVEKIGEFKKENNVAIFQLSRWKEIFQSRQEWADQLNLDRQFVVEVLRLLHQQSVKTQTEVFNKKEQNLNLPND